MSSSWKSCIWLASHVSEQAFITAKLLAHLIAGCLRGSKYYAAFEVKLQLIISYLQRVKN